MFNRCRKWRKLLNRDMEGKLSIPEQTLLREHLAICDSCSKRFNADLALRSIASNPTPSAHHLDPAHFDEMIIMRLRQPLPSQSALPPVRIFHWLHGKTNGFYAQVFSGTVAAAGITGLLMLSALQPRVTRTTPTSPPIEFSQNVTHNSPPVPLETLLRTRTPRAAMFWSPTSKENRIAPRETNGKSTPRGSSAPRKNAPIRRTFSG